MIGGGPAGTATAITASRHGARVLLLERGRFPRHKVCGEFVSAESHALLASLLAGTQGEQLLACAPRIDSARLIGTRASVQSAVDPAAFSISRYDLDLAMWNAAVRSGAHCRDSVVVQDTDAGAVCTSAGDFHARTVINASGRWSNLHAEAPADSEKWLGIKAHFRGSPDARSVDLYFFPGGYCGVQPITADAFNVSALVRSEVASSIEEVLVAHPALRERTTNWQQITPTQSTFPAFFRDPQPVRDGVLNVGDAAGFIDPFLGDGISLALRSGALAAECAISDPGTAAIRYSAEYERRFVPSFRNAARLRRVIALPQAAQPILALALQVPGVLRYVMRKTRGR